MSVEAPTMSGGPAISPAVGAIGSPSLGAEMLMAGNIPGSFGPEISSPSIDIGGAYQPDLNNEIFSMPELKAPTAGSFNYDKVAPDLAFDNNFARIEWQALSSLKSDPSPLESTLNTTLNAPQAEVFLIQQSEQIISNFIAQPEPVLNLEPQVSNFVSEVSDVLTMPEIEQREIIADAKQAIRVKEALIAIGTKEEEAHETALKILTEKQEKKYAATSLMQKKQEEIQQFSGEKIPVHDDKADAKRVSIAMEISKEVVDEANRDGREPTGDDLVKEMPVSPQKELISGIAQGGKDGSYDGFTKDIREIEVVDPDKILTEIQTAMENNHAVDIGQNPAKKATENEVRKVSSGIIFENKI